MGLEAPREMSPLLAFMVQGYLTHKKHPPSLGPPYGPRQSPTVGSYEGVVSYECRRWSLNPSGKCSYERPTRGTVCGTVRSMCGADAGCLAMNYQSLSNPEIRKQLSAGGASPSLSFMPAPSFFEDGAGIHTTFSLGPLGFDFAQRRQTRRPSRRRGPQQSPASFRIAVKDLEDPAVQCRWLVVSV